MYIAPGQGQKTTWGLTFDLNKSLRPFVANFKQISLNSDFIHMGRGRQPFVDKILMSTEKPHHFAHLLQVSLGVRIFM